MELPANLVLMRLCSKIESRLHAKAPAPETIRDRTPCILCVPRTDYRRKWQPLRSLLAPQRWNVPSQELFPTVTGGLPGFPPRTILRHPFSG